MARHTWGERLNCSLVPPEAKIYGNCQWCGKKLEGRRTVWCSRTCNAAFFRNHDWKMARNYTNTGQCEDCGKCEHKKGYTEMQVHHIVPLNGAQRSMTCANHEDNLVCLCKECHKERHRKLREQAHERD